MPELPEVETVRRGLSPVMEGYVFERVELRRPNLRFPFPDGFATRLEGQTITRFGRRAKFLDVELSSGERLLMHLGMSGRFTIDGESQGKFVSDTGGIAKHDHVIFHMSSGHRVIYNDPRRFGFMELVKQGETPERLKTLGPEPLSNSCNAPDLREKLRGKKSKIKAALLDQRIIAGLGNIYVCEALFRARISPKRAAGRLTVAETESLTRHIKDVIFEAIEAGGLSLRDFAQADGDLGYFQHSFDVYGREGEPCPVCGAALKRITQSGRSSFYCSACQK